jgi:hypothetical protein
MKRGNDNIEPHKVCNLKEYSHLRKLEYFRPNIVRLDLPFILTENKILVLDMPYLKMEGHHIDAIRLINVRNDFEFVYLKIKDIQTKKVYTLSWSLMYEGNYWLWSLTSLNYISIIIANP